MELPPVMDYYIDLEQFCSIHGILHHRIGDVDYFNYECIRKFAEVKASCPWVLDENSVIYSTPNARTKRRNCWISLREVENMIGRIGGPRGFGFLYFMNPTNAIYSYTNRYSPNRVFITYRVTAENRGKIVLDYNLKSLNTEFVVICAKHALLIRSILELLWRDLMVEGRHFENWKWILDHWQKIECIANGLHLEKVIPNLIELFDQF